MEGARVGGCMSPAAHAEGAVGCGAGPDHGPGWRVSSPTSLAVVLTEGLSLGGSTVPPPVAASRWPAVYHPLPGTLDHMGASQCNGQMSDRAPLTLCEDLHTYADSKGLKIDPTLPMALFMPI